MGELLQRCLPPQPTSPWIFPGATPGTHTTYSIRRRLARHDLPHAAPARAAALIDLAANLPAAVLADLLGIHIHTAESWGRYAQQDWAAYLYARQTTVEQPRP